MRGTRGVWVAAALSIVAAGSIDAQASRRTGWELGGFGTYHGYSDAIGVNAGWGGGVRLGYLFAPSWALEGEYSIVDSHRWATGEENNETPIRLRLAYHLPVNANNRFIVGAGFSHYRFDPDIASQRTSNQFGGAVGWQMALSRLFALRVQGTWDRFVPTQSVAQNEKPNVFGVDFGLSIPGNRRPGDFDRDGVLNNVDACPNTPVGDAIDGRGCSLPKDADSDGVTDPNDACPGTPSGDRIDGRGCSLPKDADNDGVIDANDRCANTPSGTPVDGNGCPRDTDGDGVTDNNDRCAGTPAGTPVDGAGCALPDTDGDGVLDRDDRCAGTPTGMRVDARGCQLLFDTGAGRTALVLEGVTFATGSATLADSSLPVLNRVAESLVANAEVRVEVQGHTDNSGSAATNRRLSQRRADAVRSYLISKGVDGSRLTAMGYGPDQPKTPNTSAANRAMNRRVELKQLP